MLKKESWSNSALIRIILVTTFEQNCTFFRLIYPKHTMNLIFLIAILS